MCLVQEIHCTTFAISTFFLWASLWPEVLNQNIIFQTSMVVQQLRQHVPSVGVLGLIPGWGTIILHASQSGKKKKFNKRIK